MQPQVLNTITFSKYGNPLRNTIEPLTLNFSKQEIKREKRFYKEMWHFDGNIYIEPVDGVGVIYITTDLEKEPIVFLLDKIVEINAAIYFCVVSYGCDFTFNLYAYSKKQKFETQNHMTSQGIMPKIKVEELYTVLYQEKERGFVFKGEKHPYWELTYVDKGSMICAVDGKDIRLEHGTLLFFSGMQYHSQRADGESIVSFFTVTFDLDFSRNDMLNGIVIHADDAICQILKNMLKEYRSKSIYNEEMIISLLMQVIIYSFRSLQIHSSEQNISSSLSVKVKSKLVSDVLRIIGENIGSALTIDVLALKLCVSSSLLTKVFKNETGDNISEYIQSRRMEMAKDLIRTGNYSITQVSDMLGFCSVCYFSAAFKRKFAIAPSTFSRAVNQE